jgi:hypothetical protein
MMQDHKWEFEVGQRRERTVGGAIGAPAPAEAVIADTAPVDERELEKELPWTWRPKPVLTFLLRFANGNTRGVRYYDILGLDDLGGEIVLYCERCTITIKGRHLKHLFQRLAEDRVLVIQEQHRPEWKDESRKPYIESITIGEPRFEALTSAPQRHVTA